MAKTKTGNNGKSRAGSIEAAPIVALAAGVAIGAVAGALLPRTQRETDLLGPVGSKLGQAAGDIAKAARQAGQQELGLVGDSKSPVDILVEKAVGALGAAGNAAASSVTRKRDA